MLRLVEKVITKEIAEEFLSHNKSNRNVNARRVEQYKRDLRSGAWKTSDSMICIDNDGNLLNGQHRLMAVAQTGIPVTMVLAYGAPLDIVCDRHMPRTTLNQLVMNRNVPKELRNRYVVTAATNVLSHLDGNPKHSDHELEEFILSHENTFRLIKDCASKGGNVASSAISKKAGVLTAIFFAAECGVPSGMIEQFCSIVNSGFVEDAALDSSAIILRNYALATLGSCGHGPIVKLSNVAQSALKDFASRTPRRRQYNDATPGCYLEMYRKRERAASLFTDNEAVATAQAAP